jgi:hypothetical protein
MEIDTRHLPATSSVYWLRYPAAHVVSCKATAIKNAIPLGCDVV